MHDLIREHISFADTDRIFSEDIENAIKLLQSKKIIKRLNETAKKHRIDIKNEEHEVFGL
jgi:histidine ammonia-lyase